MTMGVSIECRVPLLDFRIIEMAAALPSSELVSGWQGKMLMRRAVGSRLPPPVLSHRKWGFGVPWRQYFRNDPELRDLVATLPRLEPIDSGPFSRPALQAVVRSFLNGDDRYESLIRGLVMMVVWHQACFSNGTQSGEAADSDRFAQAGLAPTGTAF
jgi:asparagine synthase (glutamine-hydrolysing)